MADQKFAGHCGGRRGSKSVKNCSTKKFK